jgi:drug/metabolite transporter (DMT)-like permease
MNSSSSRAFALLLLALACLFWAGNWIAGRVLRDVFDPVTLNFLRWAGAAAVLAPFAWKDLIAARAAIRRAAPALALLGLTGVALFNTLIYVGLHTTTAINGVLLGSSGPLFILLCSWVIERERATPRQVGGMLISLAGILVILSHGDAHSLLRLDIHPGDGWILLAMLVWGLYSVLLKRRPPELGGTALLFLITLIGISMLAPFVLWHALHAPPRWPTVAQSAGVLYLALFASLGAYICWNRGVAVVGANAAGFTLHLVPAFGTGQAMLFLGEAFHGFHAAGIAAILVGVIVATRPPSGR